MVDSPDREFHRNPNLYNLETDFLYHFDLNSSMELQRMFGDVTHVCMGGSADRVKEFALEAAHQLGITLPPEGLQPYGKTERYSLYKVGPIIFVSHGISSGSALIVFHEVIKMLEYARCKNFKFIRVGTSGGIGAKEGDVVVTTEALDEKLDPEYEQYVLGKRKVYDTQLNPALAQAILASAGKLRVLLGKTISVNDFYEGQVRVDGGLDPGYTRDEAEEYLQEAYEKGVRNMEMEARALAYFCLRAGIPAAVVCAVIVDRLEGDQITATGEQLRQYSDNAEQVVINYLKGELHAD